MNHEKFIEILKSVAQRDTSADPSGWTADNPLWGHCAVASLLAQDLYGGELVRGSLKDHPTYARLRSHYWNRFDKGETDLTHEQYLDLSYTDLEGEVRSRESVLAHPDTMRRYTLLKERFAQKSERI